MKHENVELKIAVEKLKADMKINHFRNFNETEKLNKALSETKATVILLENVNQKLKSENEELQSK